MNELNLIPTEYYNSRGEPFVPETVCCLIVDKNDKPVAVSAFVSGNILLSLKHIVCRETDFNFITCRRDLKADFSLKILKCENGRTMSTTIDTVVVSDIGDLGIIVSRGNNNIYLRIEEDLPKVGDVVHVCGYDISLRKIFPYIAKVSEVYRNGREGDRSRHPFPYFSIKPFIPSGYSGSPVLNKEGKIVGVLSSSWEGYESLIISVSSFMDIKIKDVTLLSNHYGTLTLREIISKGATQH